MADGKVIISTELDNSRIPKGIRAIEGALGGLKSVVGKLGIAIASAFAVQRIVQFGKESVQAANDLSNALVGLQSILDGQGRSFSAAQSFIEEYTKDGLIPATNAITAYKNLAMRGYDDSQIQQVMVALKDASAFGRQASYSMGEAVESATEGLKNENSILVDNAGVTKNVAKMWEEYAASIGTTANNLTQQQKIQAEVNGILEESKYQTGDAAKVAGTLTGQLTQLSYNFNNLKVAVGNAINPIVKSFIPVINSAVQVLTKFANAVASVVGALFGKASVQTSKLADSNDSVASSASAGADAEKELADATKAAGKAAQKSLAPFDELNRLQSDTGSGGTGGVTNGVVGGGVSTSIVAEAQVEDTISPKLQAIADKIKELVEPLKNIDFSPAVAAFGRLKEAIAPITEKLFEGLEWAWYNILVPLAKWTVEDALPAFLDLLSAALGALNSAIDALQPLGIWLWEEFLQPLAEWTGDLIVSSLSEITDLLQKISDLISGNTSFSDFIASLTPAQTAIAGIVASLSTIYAISAGMSAFKTITTSINGMITAVKTFKATGVIGKIAEVFSLAAAGSGSLIEKINNIGEAMNLVFGTAATTIAGISSVVGGAVLAITNFFSMLANGFDWLKEILMVIGIAIAAVGAVILGAPALVAGVVAAIVAAVATAVVVIKDNWDAIVAWFSKICTSIGQFFTILWTKISEAASTCWAAIVKFFTPAVEWFSKLFGSIRQTVSDVFYNIGVIASGCWEIVKAVWGVVSGWFNTTVIQPVSKFFANLWDGFLSKARSAWEGVKTVFGNVASFFKDTFQKAWQGIVKVFSVAGEIFVNIKDGIVSAFKKVVNGIIGGINRVVSIPFNSINSALRTIKNINILGLTPFSGLRTISVPQIPYLAQGAVLPANKPFLAMVGDQKHGTNIEAPLETIQEAVALVMEDYISAVLAGDEAIVAVLREILQAVLGIEIGDDAIYRAVERHRRKINIARGGV